MASERPAPLMIMWQRAEWRCEYLRVGPNLVLRLFYGNTCVQQQLIPNAATGKRFALEWRQQFDRGE
jgi:hypothetical protein